MPGRNAKRDRWFLAFAFLLALALRLVPYRAATAGGLKLLSPDCYGHARRSLATARRFPHVPTFDPNLDFPHGAVWIWGPLFDLLGGGVTRAVFGRDATLDDAAWVGAFTAPVLGALHVFPLFAFARRALSRRRARVAVLAYTVLPAAVLWSCFGHFDHHVAEALLLLTFLAACARALDRDLPARGRLARIALAGGVLGLAVLNWHGAVFIAAVALPWAALALAEESAVLYGAATAVAALGTAVALGNASVPFSFVSFGWFQPLFLAALTLPCALLAAWRSKKTARLSALAAVFVLAAIVLPNVGALSGAVFRGSAYMVTKGKPAADGDYDRVRGGYLSYPPELLKLIFEAQPLVSSADGAVYAVRELSVGFALLPIAGALWLRSASRARGRGRRLKTLLVLFAGALFVMTLFQKRNTYYVAIFAALALAELCARMRAPRVARRVLAPILALLLVLAPGGALLARTASYAEAPGGDFLDLMRRLARLDPPPADLATLPPASATTGVMCPWSAGHYVSALSGRPAGADPFAYGFLRQSRLYATRDPEEVKAILLEARCKYLVTTALPDAVLAGYARASGIETPPSESALRAVHLAAAERPLPFLTLALVSRSFSRDVSGALVPRFKVYRVEGVEDPHRP